VATGYWLQDKRQNERHDDAEEAIDKPSRSGIQSGTAGLATSDLGMTLTLYRKLSFRLFLELSEHVPELCQTLLQHRASQLAQAEAVVVFFGTAKGQQRRQGRWRW